MLESWQEFIFQPFGGFLIVFIGTMFLFAEVLVKGRFIFGLVGLASMSMYFWAHVHEGQLLWMAVLYFIGLMLIILDGKFLGDGTMAVIGGILMIISLALPSPDILYGVCVGAAFVIGAACSLAFLKFFPKRDLWSKMTLKHSLTSEKGYNSINEGYKSLIGQEGEAFTRFNPTGTIRIDGQNYSATSQGVWIEKGSRIKVIQVTGTHILIEKVESGEDTEDV